MGKFSKKIKRTTSIRPYGPYRALAFSGPMKPIAMRPKRYSGSYGGAFPDLFPEKKAVTLVYCQQGVLSPASSGLGAVQVFRANSLYDPDLSGVGHQPRYRDIMASVYERYAVESSSIEVCFWAPGSSSAGQCNVYVTLRPSDTDDPSTASSWETIEENGAIRTKPLGARDGGHDVTKCYQRYSARAMFGSSAMGEDDLSALFGANPSKSPIFAIGVCPINPSDLIGGIRYTVKIKYHVTAYRKKHDLGQD